MDIDTFLDKELKSGVQSGEQDPVRLEDGEELASDIPSLSRQIRGFISEGKLEEVEKAYVALWSNLSREGLNWDKATNQEIETLSSEIERDFSSIEQQFSQHAQRIEQLIRQARQRLDSGQHQDAHAIYQDITSQAKELPNAMFDRKKNLERDILRLYHDIHERLGSDILRKVSMAERRIRDQIARLRPLANAGHLDPAAQHFTQILKLYNQIPIGFLRLKVELGKELLGLYRTIAIQREIADLRRQLGSAQRSDQRGRSVLAPRHEAQKASLSDRKKQSAKDNAGKGDYASALHDIDFVLRMHPQDQEARQLREQFKQKVGPR